MKRKVLLLSFLIMIGFTLGAQTESVTESVNEYKPDKGNITLEVGFSPIGINVNTNGQPVFANIIGFGLKNRYVLHEKFYLRMNIPFEGSATTVKQEINEGVRTKTTNRYVSYGFYPGMEFHMGKMPKLSPYIGSEIGFTHNIYNTTQVNPAGVDDVLIRFKNININGQRSNITFAINMFAGFDWYITKNLYLGAELGFGVGVSTSLTSKVVTIIANQTTSVRDNTKEITTNFGVSPLSLIRLGWAF